MTRLVAIGVGVPDSVEEGVTVRDDERVIDCDSVSEGVTVRDSERDPERVGTAETEEVTERDAERVMEGDSE